MPYGTNDEARQVLETAQIWAVVGLGATERRTAHAVAEWLQARGKRIVPIHPAGGTALGEQVYRTLADVPEPIDVVEIFRRSDQAGIHVDEAIAVGASAVWLQLGVVDQLAAERAQAAGLTVLMDRCPRIDGPRLLGWPA
jgi:predicted CoA-binding protein